MINFQNNPPEKFTDGLMFFGTVSTQREVGKKVGQEFNQAGKLYYNRMSIRQSDHEEHGTDQNVDLKIKTFYTRDVSEKSHKVLIGEDLFDIYSIDSDTEEKYMYWYLAKVGRFNGTRNA